MSESILDHGYVPEEHAPDPVLSHGDPTPPGKIAIWMFLASEVMFFIGILGTYIIFRSGSPQIFAEHALALSKPLAAINTVVLLFSSLTMALAVDASQKHNRKRAAQFLVLTFLCATGFMVIKFIEYRDKFTHHTMVAKADDGKTYVFDGHIADRGKNDVTFEGVRMPMPAGPFDIHWISNRQVKEAAHAASGHAAAAAEHDHESWKIQKKSIIQDLTYGPWKNIFYACYFTLTGVHGLHVVGGMVALALLAIQAMRGKIFPAHTEYIGLYWHFVDLVWIFLFPLLYLI